MIDYEKVKSWSFEVRERAYNSAETIAFARGFGAGLPGALAAGDAAYLRELLPETLPMMAVGLADGDFWQQNPATGIDWRRIVHAGEAVTQHRPLPDAGVVTISQRVKAIYDRGPEKGALMLQEQVIGDAQGQPLITIEVSLVLKGDGGFGGAVDTAPRIQFIPIDRAADIVVELPTPCEDGAMFKISSELSVAAQGAKAGQSMLRGLGCFGLAGRAAIFACCDNQAKRLRRFSVRYAGPMFTEETMRVEIWRLKNGRAAMRMSAVERGARVLDQCLIEFN